MRRSCRARATENAFRIANGKPPAPGLASYCLHSVPKRLREVEIAAHSAGLLQHVPGSTVTAHDALVLPRMRPDKAHRTGRIKKMFAARSTHCAEAALVEQMDQVAAARDPSLLVGRHSASRFEIEGVQNLRRSI